jgi:HEAT repeat protein
MRRFVLALATVGLIVAIVFLAFFSASGYRQDNQSYTHSLSDFVFLNGYYLSRFVGLGPPPLTKRRYERTMSHANKSAHHEVDEVVFRSLERWGSAIEPYLLQEIEAWRSEGRVLAAAVVLAKLKNPAAIAAFQRAGAMGDRWLEVQILEELHELGPGAAPAMIEAFHEAGRRKLPIPYNLLEAIGRSGGGVDFLLERLALASTEDEILELQWCLAYTDDSRAARALLELMHHPNLRIRRRSRDAISQAMGVAAVEPAIDFLERETDDYLRSWIIQSILADSRASESRRVVDYLAPLVEHPVLSWEANYALARIATDDALAMLRKRARRKPVRWAISNLDYSGAAGLRLLEDYTRHEDPNIRREALRKLEEFQWHETAPIFRAALSDPDPRNRSEAERMLFETDVLVLGESLRSWLADVSGEAMGGQIRPPRWDSTRTALGAIRVLHWIGLGVSVVVGILLLIGSLRAFEPYKFALVLQFLLVAGVVGDFFLMSDPMTYRTATAARLILLLGLLFLRDDPLPGETRGRVERLAVRSLWILAPTLLLFGVPALAEALRLALQDFGFTKWVLLLLFALTVLLLEEAVLPWYLFARGSRFERAVTLALSMGVVAIFVVALWRDPSRGDREALNALLTLPLVVAVLFHVRSSRLLSSFVRPPGLPPAPGRFRAVRDRESVIVKVKPRRSFRGIPQLVIGAILLWFLVVELEVARGGAAALALLIGVAIFGTVLGGLLLTVLRPNYTIQIRDGAARSATSFFGGVIGRARWYRRLRLPSFVGEMNLNPSEKKWLARALDTA